MPKSPEELRKRFYKCAAKSSSEWIVDTTPKEVADYWLNIIAQDCTERVRCCEKCKLYVPDKYCQLSSCTCHTPPTPVDAGEWEKEFDRQFLENGPLMNAKYLNGYVLQPGVIERIHTFISTVISKEHEAILREVEGMKNPYDEVNFYHRWVAFQTAFTAVKEIIKKRK